MSVHPDISGSFSGMPEEDSPSIVGFLVMFIGLAMVAYGITALWFGMRDVMEVGGYCAEGGPYVIQQHCPDGALPLMFSGIGAGVVGIFVALFGCARAARGAAGLLLLGWPALFISLGWNFWQYGLNPPPNVDGGSAGWIVCGMVFALMGLPALLGVPTLIKAVQPERRTAVLFTLLAASAAGVALGLWVNSSVG